LAAIIVVPKARGATSGPVVRSAALDDTTVMMELHGRNTLESIAKPEHETSRRSAVECIAGQKTLEITRFRYVPMI
jgi:hypothetical protein